MGPGSLFRRMGPALKALPKSLFKYKLHTDDELFLKAFSYVRQYY